MIAPKSLVFSLHGRRVRIVPLVRCGPCGQDMPADHDCPRATLRPLLRLAVNTVGPRPALSAIKIRVEIREALHRGRTALREASISHDVWDRRRVRPDRRTWRQAGVDALRQLDAAIADLTEARGQLLAALKNETAPVAPGAARTALERTEEP